MAGGEDFIFRPILRGIVKEYEAMKGGPIDLYDLLLMNEALDVEIENQNRMAEAADTYRRNMSRGRP